MAFSAFGAKPATAGTSLFGQSAAASTTQQPTSLFGNSAANANAAKPVGAIFSNPQNQPAQGTSLFGGQTQQQQPAQGTSIFSQPQQGQSSSLFGQSQPTQQSTGTGLFGQSATGTQQQGQQTSLFGNTATQAQQAPGTSLFGQTQPAPQATGSNLFGQSNTSTQPGQTSLFGGSTTQSQAGQGSSLFGNSFAQPAQPGGLFGNTAQAQQQPQSNLFGSALGGNAGGSTSLFGGSTAPGLQKQPTLGGGFNMGASTNLFYGKQPSTQGFGATTTQPALTPLFSKTTKFNDLPDELKRIFETVDTYIQGRIQISNDLKQRKVGEEATKGQDLIRSVHKDLVNAITVLQSDVYHTRDVKSKVDQCVQDTIAATRIVDGFRNPQQYGTHLKTYANFPLEFFQRVTEEMRERLRWYKTTVEQIERKLASAATQASYTPHAITSTLEAQHATFIALSAKTAAIDGELQKIKALYTQLLRAKTGSMRDPFNDLDRGTGSDFGMESIGGK